MFKVGEIAILVADASGMFPYTIGTECTIVGPLEIHRVFPGPSPRMCYQIRLQCGGRVLAQPYELRRKRPPQTDVKLGSWDQCPWQPEIVAASITVSMPA